jgi:predicted PhzF superfamily epimerase YddE/YHI9
MRLTVVDAFTDRPFSGNPAAVAVLDHFPTEEHMQLLAREMNLSETAYAVQRNDGEYDLRWFTPATEVDLCGHATLATAHVLGGTAAFHTRSGRLTCELHQTWIDMDFPLWQPTEHSLPTIPPGLPPPRWAGVADDMWLVELASAGDVVHMKPDQKAIASLGRLALVVTAPAEPDMRADIVSRVFGPNVGIPEDPATGSAHCALAAYWCPRLGREELIGHQASSRGGTIRMRLSGDRVVVGGQAVTVSEVTVLA